MPDSPHPGTGPARRQGFPIDLHTHSWVSDGLASPTDLIDLAARCGVQFLALTDHDALDGLEEAGSAAAERGLTLIAGVEISCTFQERELHLLGLAVRPSEPALLALLRDAQASRREAFDRILTRLATCKVPIPEQAVDQIMRSPAIGRAHVGRALLAEGHVRSVGEAFARYLGEGRPARVHRDRPSFQEAVAVVLEAGGLPVLAHPGAYPGPPIDEETLRALRQQGVRGLEAHHPAHRKKRTLAYLALASRLDLLVTGGSDHHGYPGDRPPGSGGLDAAALEPLRLPLRLQKRLPASHQETPARIRESRDLD